MLIGTHALSPLLLVGGMSLARKKALEWKVLWSIALVGAAPDLLCPHITLEARQESWSHSLLGFVIVMLVPLIALILKRFVTLPLFGAYCFTYLWHLFCDAIAGGVPYLYPFSNTILGGIYIPFMSWIFFDAVFVILLFVLWKLGRRVKV